VHCHAGCDQEQVIATLRSRGLWRENGPRRFIRPTPRAAATSQPDRDDAKRTEIALAIWQAAPPPAAPEPPIDLPAFIRCTGGA
jgi:hypothetical protein